MGEVAVHEGRLAADDREVRGHQSGDPEVLAAHHAVLAAHGPGVAGVELRLVPRQGPAQVLEEAGALAQGAVGVGVGHPAVVARGPRHLLHAQHVGAAARQPLGQGLKHAAAPGVEAHHTHERQGCHPGPLRCTGAMIAVCEQTCWALPWDRSRCH